MQAVLKQKHSVDHELHDLTIKYEALEQKYNTVCLENNEYKKHIVELHKEIKDLKQELIVYEEELNDEQDLNPIIHHEMTSMRTSLIQTDQHLMKLTNQLNDYLQLIKSLKSENISMKQQNEKFRIALENNNKQKHILQQIHDEKINNNDNQINMLQNENQLLRDELNTMKTIKLNPYIVTTASPSPIISPDGTPRINLMITPEDSNMSKSLFGGITPDILVNQRNISVESLQFTTNKKEARFGSIGWRFENIDELEQKLEVLEMENAELFDKLSRMHNKTVDDEKCIDEETETDEMEKLFQKCDEGILDAQNNNDNVIEKYTFLWFEFQLRRSQIIE